MPLMFYSPISKWSFRGLRDLPLSPSRNGLLLHSRFHPRYLSILMANKRKNNDFYCVLATQRNIREDGEQMLLMSQKDIPARKNGRQDTLDECLARSMRHVAQ